MPKDSRSSNLLAVTKATFDTRHYWLTYIHICHPKHVEEWGDAIATADVVVVRPIVCRRTSFITALTAKGIVSCNLNTVVYPTLSICRWKSAAINAIGAAVKNTVIMQRDTSVGREKLLVVFRVAQSDFMARLL